MPVGIDMGGTKIELRRFDPAFALSETERVETPRSYPALLETLVQLVQRHAPDPSAPVGFSVAGLVNPQTGLVVANNHPGHGHPLPTDLARELGRPISYLNDCRALALSEAQFGAGQGCRVVAGVVLGTGVSAGVVIDGALRDGPSGTGGEIGQIDASARLLQKHRLPVWDGGADARCEAYVSGPGLARIARHLTGHDLTPEDIATLRRGDMAPVWAAWCDIAAHMLLGLTLTLDPDVIVLGGGLSKIDGVIPDLEAAMSAQQFGPFGSSPLALAAAGDASGARGAAYAATAGLGRIG
ncbi:MAG: ROK family protein [Pseudomonadota bacterium]